MVIFLWVFSRIFKVSTYINTFLFYYKNTYFIRERFQVDVVYTLDYYRRGTDTSTFAIVAIVTIIAIVVLFFGMKKPTEMAGKPTEALVSGAPPSTTSEYAPGAEEEGVADEGLGAGESMMPPSTISEGVTPSDTTPEEWDPTSEYAPLDHR